MYTTESGACSPRVRCLIRLDRRRMSRVRRHFESYMVTDHIVQDITGSDVIAIRGANIRQKVELITSLSINLLSNSLDCILGLGWQSLESVRGILLPTTTIADYNRTPQSCKIYGITSSIKTCLTSNPSKKPNPALATAATNGPLQATMQQSSADPSQQSELLWEYRVLEVGERDW